MLQYAVFISFSLWHTDNKRIEGCPCICDLLRRTMSFRITCSASDRYGSKVPEFENYQGQMYPAELEIKNTTENITSASYLDLLLAIGRDGQLYNSIYDTRVSFNFHITNVSFLRSNIPSSPAFLFLNLYNTPGLAPRMNVLFWGPGDILISYSNRDTSWNAWNRHSGSFMIDTGILFSNMKSPSREFWRTNCPLTNSDFPTDQTFHQFNDLYTEFDLQRIMSGFHGAFATGVACQQGTITLPDTWFCPPFLGLACAPIVETRFLELAMSLLDFSP